MESCQSKMAYRDNVQFTVCVSVTDLAMQLGKQFTLSGFLCL